MPLKGIDSKALVCQVDAGRQRPLLDALIILRMTELDCIIHQPVRLQIMAALSELMLIRLFQQTPIYSAQPLLDGLERFAPPRISLYDVGLRPVPRPSKVWNAAMGCLRRLWRKTNSSR